MCRLGTRALITILLITAIAAPAYALKPQSAFYVNDYVGVMSQAKADYLVQRGRQLYEQNGVQVVAVIVDNFIGESMSSYATEVFNEFGIGSKGHNNGVLLIVAMDDGEVWIEVGDGLSGQIPDSKAGRILDERFMPPAERGDLQTAVYDTYLALIQEGSRLTTPGAPIQPPGAGNGWTVWLAVALILLGLGLILLSRRSRQRPPAGTAPPRSGGPGPGRGLPPGQQRQSGDATGRYPRAPVPPVIVVPRPVYRAPRPPSGWTRDNQPSSNPPARPAPRPPAPPPSRPAPSNRGGGGQSSGGGAGRGLFGNPGPSRPSGGGFAPSPSRRSGGFGGGSFGRPSGGGGFSGGGGRSSGGGAGRGFKK